MILRNKKMPPVKISFNFNCSFSFGYEVETLEKIELDMTNQRELQAEFVRPSVHQFIKMSIVNKVARNSLYHFYWYIQIEQTQEQSAHSNAPVYTKQSERNLRLISETMRSEMQDFENDINKRVDARMLDLATDALDTYIAVLISFLAEMSGAYRVLQKMVAYVTNDNQSDRVNDEFERIVRASLIERTAPLDVKDYRGQTTGSLRYVFSLSEFMRNPESMCTFTDNVVCSDTPRTQVYFQRIKQGLRRILREHGFGYYHGTEMQEQLQSLYPDDLEERSCTLI